MKTFALTFLMSLLATQLAFCETATFQIGATIPRIVGVNYFPVSADIETGPQEQKQVSQKVVMREGQQFVLQTSIIR